MSRRSEFEVEGPAIIEFEVKERRSLREAIGKILIIKGVELREGRRGKFAVVYALVEGEDREYYTFSRVVLDQLRIVQQLIEKGNYVKAKVCQDVRRGYVYLCSPKG